MIRYGVADYGLSVWFGNLFDYEERIDFVKSLGFDGIERLYATSADEAMSRAAHLKKLGMSFATVNAPKIDQSIKWTSVLGAKYVWLDVIGANGTSDLVAGFTYDDYLRRIREMSRVCKMYGIDVVIHNHMGTNAQNQDQVEKILVECPDVKLLYDTGHMALAGGDVRYFVDKYFDRIAALHLKGRAKSKTAPDHPDWDKCGHFCGIGKGDVFVDNEYVYKYALKHGFDGWVHIEQDTHLQDPAIDLKESIDTLKKWSKEI